MKRPAPIPASDVVRRRLAGQFLTSPSSARASEIVRALGAVQAQDYAGAKWALGQRTDGLTDADIEREITDGAILRTHVMRPTWHFVSPADIRWMLALTAPRVKAAMASYDRKLELTPEVYRRSNTAIAKALRDGKHLTRTELGAVLERAGIKPVSGQRLGHLMMRAELDAVVCSGARRGKQFTYALLEERAPPAAPIERDAALLEMTRRYFTSRGPATAHDFAWWSGLSMADVKRALDIASAELERATLGEREAWFIERAMPRAKPSAHLLPNYDEYFIGFKDRSAIAQRLRSARLVTGGNALIAHIAFVDGQLVGGWKRLIEKGSTTVVSLDLLSRLSTPERNLIAAAAHRFEEFLASPVRLHVAKPGASSRA